MSEGSSKDVPGSSTSFNLSSHTEIEEPSPLDRMLADGRDFNGGGWSSEELQTCLREILKYGTRSETINYIHQNYIKTRSREEITAKIDEIREIIKEHKEVILPEAYKKKWIEDGHRNIGPPPDCEVDPNEGWSAILSKIVNHHQSSINKHFNPMRDAFEKVFETLSQNSKTVKNVKVTDMQTARATSDDTQNLRWPVIYKFMKACSTLEEQMPALNELEAAVVIKVLDSIENEASTIPDSEKAVLAGLFKECQMDDFRLCEQDYPPTLQGGVQLFVDPLRTRFHGIPEVGAEVELDHNQPSTSSSS
ncbi:hypothetical protein L5515_001151 [Caenorhabditis briggsae]|uniref:Uncharacterized protein n=2 Tax=Caenorhabditis briggsae TaxID=6238 RepID=A0AAE9E236_CAEBR|nr:hypothetical protein L3Y34_015070 [Caenorhabditis briggsae]UMM12309.1 hypothetical protein L5515_001151 [Caenorhabditis briggsae]